MQSSFCANENAIYWTVPILYNYVPMWFWRLLSGILIPRYSQQVNRNIHSNLQFGFVTNNTIILWNKKIGIFCATSIPRFSQFLSKVNYELRFQRFLHTNNTMIFPNINTTYQSFSKFGISIFISVFFMPD